MTDSPKPKKPRHWNENAQLRGAWRRKFTQSPIVDEIMDAGTRRVPRYNKDGSRAKVDSKEIHCQVCNQWVKASLNGKNNAQVDHIIPVIDVLNVTGEVKDWNEYHDRLFCNKSNLQRICSPCHDMKTKKERETRQLEKDRIGLDDLEKRITFARSVTEEKALKKEVAKYLTKTKLPVTKERALKLKAHLIERLTKED